MCIFNIWCCSTIYSWNSWRRTFHAGYAWCSYSVIRYFDIFTCSQISLFSGVFFSRNSWRNIFASTGFRSIYWSYFWFCCNSYFWSWKLFDIQVYCYFNGRIFCSYRKVSDYRGCFAFWNVRINRISGSYADCSYYCICCSYAAE